MMRTSLRSWGGVVGVGTLVVLSAVAAACGGGGGDSASSGAGGSGTTAGGTGGGSTGGATQGHAFPLTLTPLTAPLTASADISLYFSVTDANDVGVPNLASDDFVALEDGVPVDKLESSFSTAPLSGQSLDLPTVLLLDLSASIVKGGALDQVKAAAKAIVDAMVPEQRMALVTFADQPTTRVDFTANKDQLKGAIAAISQSDGVSTNLYGSLVQAVGMWGDDGFNNDPAQAKLKAGLCIVMTDGKDTAGVATLQQVLDARQNKRVVTVGIGNDVGADALKSIGDAGFIQTASYDALASDVSKITTTMQTLSKSIYKANYCSPKRAGTHELSFTVHGNESYNGNGGNSGICQEPALDAASFLKCAQDPTLTAACGSQVCCGPTRPFACVASGNCYASAGEASKECAGSCVHCGADQGGAGGSGAGGPDVGLQPGTSIQLSFMANGYSSGQCPAFWGTACKALQQCCTSLPPNLAANCVQQLDGAVGVEAICNQYSQQYCPAYGAACKALQTCCEGLPPGQKESCEGALFQTSADETQCTSYAQQFCPVAGAECKALKTCCDGLPAGQKETCTNALTEAAYDESTCQGYLGSFCPAQGANCKALTSCCNSLSTAGAQVCTDYQAGANNDESSCAQIKKTFCGPLVPACQTFIDCCDGLAGQMAVDCFTDLANAAGNASSCTNGTSNYCPGGACVTCSQYASAPIPAGNLCAPSAPLWDALQQCACNGCPLECGQSLCMPVPQAVSQGCGMCIQNKCAAETMACVND